MLKVGGKYNGFTLLEALLATAIFLVVLSITYSFYLSNSDLIDITGQKSDLQSYARRAIQMMTSELRQTTMSRVTIPDSRTLRFYLPTYDGSHRVVTDTNDLIVWDTTNQITYTYLTGQKELRRQDNNRNILIARDVSNVQFIKGGSLLPDELKIILNFSRTAKRQRVLTFTLSSIVALRN